MSQKLAIFAFAGESGCFAHALLNALDMAAKGNEVRLIVEGKATAMVRDLQDPAQPFAVLYNKVKAAGLIDAVCRACAARTGALAAAESQGLPLVDEMGGHPSMARYLAAGYQIITI